MAPQTIKFELRLEYMQVERSTDRPTSAIFLFDSFEKMMDKYHAERRRRALADRATAGSYKWILTDHGQNVIAHDEDRRRAHQDAIDGTVFKINY